MSDRQFTDCCYGTDWQHTAAQDCPLDLHFDSSTQSYRDRFNNVFVEPVEGGWWQVSSRERGNVTHVHGNRNDLVRAMELAREVICDRRADMRGAA